MKFQQHRDQKQMVALKIFKLFLANASFWKFTEKLADIWNIRNEIKYTHSHLPHPSAPAAAPSCYLACYLSVSIVLVLRISDSLGDTTKLVVIVTLRHFTLSANDSLHIQTLSSNYWFSRNILPVLNIKLNSLKLFRNVLKTFVQLSLLLIPT